MQKLLSVDFYRKMPDDIAHATKTGAILSWAAAFLMGLLFLTELSSYLSGVVTTSFDIDTNSAQDIEIFLKITTPHVACQFLSIDASNVLGTRRTNISKSIQKYRITGDSFTVFGDAVGDDAGNFEVVHADLAANAAMDHSIQMVGSNFDSELTSSDIVLVNFYAPWCPWSARLAPIWEATAALIHAKYPITTVKVARVDCTDPSVQLKCREHHINAFPTVRVYRRGSNQAAGGPHEHQAYYGDRTPEAIATFVDLQVQSLEKKVEVEKKMVQQLPGIHTMQNLNEYLRALQEHGVNQNFAKGLTDGCFMEGFLRMKRVPGSIAIVASSKSHSFDPQRVNMTHRVHQLSFINPVLEGTHLLSKDKEKMFRSESMNEKWHVSKEGHASIEHYVKVLHVTDVSAMGYVAEEYKYTSASGLVSENKELVPEIRISYDLSPLSVTNSRRRPSFLHFLVQLCAIIGGIFTVFGLLDASIYKGLRWWKKKAI